MLEEFLTPLKLETIINRDTLSNDQLGNCFRLHETIAPDLMDTDIAIIGVNDDRGSLKNRGSAQAPDKIRKHLYQLFRGHSHMRIADLGNLERGATLRDTYVALSKIVTEILHNKVVPIIIGGGHDLTYGHYGGYQEMGKMINVSVIDNMIDIRENEDEINSDNYLINLLTHQPNYLFNYSQIGYQTHFTSELTIETLDKLHFDLYRLGKVRDNIKDMEPIMRDTDMLSFDMSAIRYSDAPGNLNATPNGISGEEACQIARYAGLSDKLSSFGLYEVNPLHDVREQTQQLAAQMIWYFIDGFYNRKKIIPKDADQDFTKYIVHFRDNSYEMVFWKSLRNDMWWMEVPSGSKSKRPNKKHLIPCSYEDYQNACKEELPERWLKTYEKLS